MTARKTHPKFNPEDIINQKFGSLTVKKFVNKVYNTPGSGPKYYYECLCDCGAISIVSRTHLMTGHTKSCGARKRHGSEYSKMIHTRLHRIWNSMHARCECVKHPGYEQYKDKTICQEWHHVYNVHQQQGFINFYNWAISHGYADNLTIDRIDGTKGYNPENCRWVTIAEQCRNLKTNVNITYNNETHCLNDWCRILNISLSAVKHCKTRHNLSYPEIFDRYTKQYFDVKKQMWLYKDTNEIAFIPKRAVNKCGSNKHSSDENKIYDLLCTKFKNIKRSHYDEDLYPFACNFYIEDIDTWIEYQGNQAHNFEPYNPMCKSHLEKVEYWKKRIPEIESTTNKKSQYRTYIDVWTRSDPLKRQTAAANHLNWLEFFTLDEFLVWFDSL